MLLKREVQTVVGEALDVLSAEQRAVVELTYYQGCGYREIAEIMNCPVDTVKTRMFHARRKLKAALNCPNCSLPASSSLTSRSRIR